MKVIEMAKLARALMCLQREMGRRKSLYPKWVDEGRMDEKTAQVEISDLQDAIDILQALKTHEIIAVMKDEQSQLFGVDDQKRIFAE